MNRLRELRAEKGFSQEALARKARTSADMIHRIERHDYVPGIRVRWNLADALGIRPGEIWPDYYKKWSMDDYEI